MFNLGTFFVDHDKNKGKHSMKHYSWRRMKYKKSIRGSPNRLSTQNRIQSFLGKSLFQNHNFQNKSYKGVEEVTS